jgi:hypothetical protein
MCTRMWSVVVGAIVRVRVFRALSKLKEWAGVRQLGDSQCECKRVRPVSQGDSEDVACATRGEEMRILSIVERRPYWY